MGQFRTGRLLMNRMCYNNVPKRRPHGLRDFREATATFFGCRHDFYVQSPWVWHRAIGIDTEQSVHAAIQVCRVHGTVGDFGALVVRGAYYVASFEASACNNRREAFAVMRPAAIPGRAPLDFRASSKFAAPPYNCAVEQAAVGKVLH